MARYEATVPSVRTQQDTFDYLSRFSNTEDWDPSAERGRDLQDGGPVAVGSRFELDFKIAGRVTELTYEVTEYDRPEKVRLFCDAGWFTSDDTIEVAPDGDGSAVTYTAIVKMKGPLGLFDPIMQLGFNRAGKQAAEGLRETLDAPIVSRRMTRVGVLTGGGDCPGLNAVIRGVARTAVKRHGHELVGLPYGWAGAMNGDTTPLTLESTAGILPRGGTILGTSRTNPFKDDGGPEQVLATLEREGIDALIPIGGEDTLGVAKRLHSEHGVPVVGVPKTIDNDLDGTDFTFGFQTAVQIATDAIDRLHTTAESHNRVIIVEVMGRHAGWIAVHAGMAGGADAILIPERPFDVEEVCDHLRRRHDAGRNFSIVVVSEGAVPADGDGPSSTGQTDAFGHARLGGIAVQLEGEIEERTGYESRMTILGHVQRGGTPTAYDRVLATRFGVAAADAVADGDFGKMVALRGTRIERVPIDEALAEPKLVDPELYETAEVFFG